MHLRMRSTVIGALALLATLLGTAQASALTLSPSGSYTMSSGQVTFGFTSNGQRLICAFSTVSFSVGADGTGSAPAGSSTYGTCSNSLLGTFTVTQTSDWTMAVTTVPLSPSGTQVVLTRTIPASGLQWHGAGCDFWLEGTLTLGHLYAGGSPIAVSTTNVFTYLSTTLRVSRSTCSALLTTAGLAASLAASYTFSRSFTVSG